MVRPKKRHVAARFGDGHIRLVEQDVPELKPGTVLVKVGASLVSPGTELGSWRTLADWLKKPNDSGPNPFGYSNAGTVIEVTKGAAEEFEVGQRVACLGGGYALHTDYAVMPHNLCAALPDEVTFAQGSYAMLAATALHQLRRADLNFGENFCVVGLGLLGQICAQLHQLNGQYVIGWDTIPFRTELARKWGIDATATVGVEDEVAVTNEFTRGRGLDGGVLAFGGDGNSALKSLGQCMKMAPDGHCMGVITVVGNPTFQYSSHESRGMTNIDIRRASRTGFGYHDEHWEFGPAYPPTVMRWTTRTNLELCMRLIGEGRLNVDALTTHTVPFQTIEQDMVAALADPDGILGVVFVPPAS